MSVDTTLFNPSEIKYGDECWKYYQLSEQTIIQCSSRTDQI